MRNSVKMCTEAHPNMVKSLYIAEEVFQAAIFPEKAEKWVQEHSYTATVRAMFVKLGKGIETITETEVADLYTKTFAYALERCGTLVQTYYADKVSYLIISPSVTVWQWADFCRTMQSCIPDMPAHAWDIHQHVRVYELNGKFVSEDFANRTESVETVSNANRFIAVPYVGFVK